MSILVSDVTEALVLIAVVAVAPALLVPRIRLIPLRLVVRAALALFLAAALIVTIRNLILDMIAIGQV